MAAELVPQFSRKRGRLCTPPLKDDPVVATMPVIKAAATSTEPLALFLTLARLV